MKKGIIILLTLIVALSAFAFDWGVAFESDFKNKEIEQLSKFNLNFRTDLGFLYAYIPVGLDNEISQDFDVITIYPNKKIELSDLNAGIYFIRERVAFLQLKLAVENSVTQLLNYKDYKVLLGTGIFFTKHILFEASMKESIGSFSDNGFKPNVVLGVNFLF